MIIKGIEFACVVTCSSMNKVIAISLSDKIGIIVDSILQKNNDLSYRKQEKGCMFGQNQL